MDTGKRAHGWFPRPAVVHPWGLMNARKQGEGTTLSRKAATHGPSWPRGSDAKDAPLRGPRQAMRRHRRADRPGKSRPSTKKASRVAAFDARLDGKARPIAPMATRVARRTAGDGKTPDRIADKGEPRAPEASGRRGSSGVRETTFESASQRFERWDDGAFHAICSARREPAPEMWMPVGSWESSTF